MIENWRSELSSLTHGACMGCSQCDGYGCRGEIPGLGGLGKGKTFINNCLSWNELSLSNLDLSEGGAALPDLVVAPMTGVKENMGNPFSESDFHCQIVAGAKQAGIISAIGDGTPDYKIKAGIQALRSNKVKGAIFFKPYSNSKLFERYEWVSDVATICGLDIDSYKIVTMQGKVLLEKKSATQLIELKHHFKFPFIVKGVSTEEDVKLMEEVKPDIIVVSNHGGRVAMDQEGIAYSFQRYADRLRNICGELWVDGGIRKKEHLIKAGAMGASKVLIGRPFILGTVKFGVDGVSHIIKESFQ